jgi:uncharacterized delta-60 repeat protein
MKFCHSLLLSIYITIVLTCGTQAQFSQLGELDTTFNFGRTHGFFTDPANPQPGEGANNPVYSLARQPDGKVLIGGFFTSYNGTSRNRIARLNVDGSPDTTFNPGTGADSWVRSLALQPDGKVLIGGEFSSYNGTARNRIARLNADGSLDTTFNPGTGAGGSVPVVWSLSLQPDGKVLIGGEFSSYNGTPRNFIARLNADGSLDATFNPGTGADDWVYSLTLQPDGKVLIGGGFTSYNGTTRNRIARLNTNGSLDVPFNPGTGANFPVSSLGLQPDGKVLIGGGFTSYNGMARNRIARLNADGSLDATFNPGTGVGGSFAVFSLAVQPDGKVMIGGWFTSYNGTSRNHIARLNADGSLDTTFNPGTGANFPVSSLGLQPDGKVLIGGGFTSYNGTSRNRIARLNADGSLDTIFNPGTGANGTVHSLALQPDGKVLIGGEFTLYNGIYRSRISRVFSTGSNVGINESIFSMGLEISAYPVPFQNELRIKTQAPFRYEIMDLRGIVQLSGLSLSTEATCLTENLVNGMYLVKITLDGQTYVRKVVKE